MTDIRDFFSKKMLKVGAGGKEDEAPIAPIAPIAPVKRSVPPVDEGGSPGETAKTAKTAKASTTASPAGSQHKGKPGPKPRDQPVLKLLVVKNEGEAPGFLCRPEYEKHAKHVVATHRNIRVCSEDTVTHTVKQRGQIDAEIGEHEEALGFDELLGLVDAARAIAELLAEGDGSRLVVIGYRKKGVHGAYLLGKLAWSMVARQNKELRDATKVGEPGRWLYSELWKEVKSQKPDKLVGALGEWYRANSHGCNI
jgi:hypothetical protein